VDRKSTESVVGIASADAVPDTIVTAKHRIFLIIRFF
jgi:hypothetical protein